MEPDNDNKVQPPLLRCLIKLDDDSSDDKDNTADRIEVKDVGNDNTEILEEAPPEGCGY